eukprot:3146657-Amphidinium_carterae.1
MVRQEGCATNVHAKTKKQDPDVCLISSCVLTCHACSLSSRLSASLLIALCFSHHSEFLLTCASNRKIRRIKRDLANNIWEMQGAIARMVIRLPDQAPHASIVSADTGCCINALLVQVIVALLLLSVVALIAAGYVLKVGLER